MLSRVADSLYWIGRYLERAEHTVRVLGVNLNLMREGSTVKLDARWKRVMRSLAVPGDLQDQDVDTLVHAMCFDLANSASVSACVGAARENARQVRDEISSEQWQKLNRLYHRVVEMRSQQRYA